MYALLCQLSQHFWENNLSQRQGSVSYEPKP